MPWLSRSPSPMQSPRQMSLSKTAATSPLSYIPPLIDGACGTVLRAEQPTSSLLREDARVTMRMVPGLFWSLWTELLCNCRSMSWADMGDVLVHIALTIIELYAMVGLIPLWLAMPGAVFALWCCACAILIAGLSRMLNGPSRIIRCSAGQDGWMMGQESEDERWIFVGGMELSSRQLSQKTLPGLSKLFSKSFTGISLPSYGLPLDLISMLIQRNTSLPSETTRILYTQIRSALLDPAVNRVVVLSHNLGSLPASKVISQLFCDLPAGKLSKLEIYTFGAASSEFVLPTGETRPSADQPQSPTLPNGHHNQPILEQRRSHTPPHIEHFALTSDPFARVGVLRSSRENLETRFCGGVFVISPNNMLMSMSGTTAQPKNTSVTGLSMDAYLTCLFPTQMTSSRGGGVLDEVMVIDRDVAEKREFAAMSNFAALRSAGAGGGKKERLSWTGLGATAGQRRAGGAAAGSAVMDGVAGLEMARKGCKDCDGHRGREVSWLVRYVNVGCVEGLRRGGREGEGEPMVNGNGRME